MLDPAAYRTIAVTVSDGIAVLTLNRPDRANAVDDVMHSELSTIFSAAQDDGRVRVIVLTGAGRAFSTGGDEAPDRAYATTTGRTPIDEARHIVDDLIAMTKPLIAAVNGHAIGLGAVLATLADISYVADGAKLGDLHVHAALPAGNGAAVIWPLLIGINRAKHLLMAGELVTAAEAERVGLITRALPTDEVLPSAMAMAERLAGLAPQAVQGTKSAINRLLAMSSNAVLPLSLALEGAAMESDEFRSDGETRQGMTPHRSGRYDRYRKIVNVYVHVHNCGYVRTEGLRR